MLWHCFAKQDVQESGHNWVQRYSFRLNTLYASHQKHLLTQIQKGQSINSKLKLRLDSKLNYYATGRVNRRTSPIIGGLIYTQGRRHNRLNYNDNER